MTTNIWKQIILWWPIMTGILAGLFSALISTATWVTDVSAYGNYIDNTTKIANINSMAIAKNTETLNKHDNAIYRMDLNIQMIARTMGVKPVTGSDSSK